MPFPIRIEGMLAKIETTYGVDSTPTVGSDAVRVNERLWPTITPNYAWENERTEVVSGTNVPPPDAIPRGRYTTMDFGWELKGSRSGGAYSAGNKIEASPLLRSCAMQEAIDTTGGAEKLTYTRDDDTHESCTIWAYAAGWLYKVVGCRGSVGWTINAGTLTSLRFRMMGMVLVTPTEVALPGGIVYASPQPLAGVNLALAIGAWAPDVQTASWDVGANVQRLDSANAADGIHSFDSGGIIQPTFNISAKAVAASTYNAHADKLARTARALTLQYGTVQYNKAKLTTNLYVSQVRNTDQQGFAGWDISYKTDGSDTLLFN